MLRSYLVVMLMSAVALSAGPLAVPAMADSDHDRKSPAYGHPGDREPTERHDSKQKKAKKEKKNKGDGHRFGDEDRVVVHDFYAHNPGALPPGLAKRGGALPPGLAKRGGDLPPGLSRNQVITPEIEVHLTPLPRELELKLPPPPHEVIRRIIGRDIVLIHERNRQVLDVMRDALP